MGLQWHQERLRHSPPDCRSWGVEGPPGAPFLILSSDTDSAFTNQFKFFSHSTTFTPGLRRLLPLQDPAAHCQCCPPPLQSCPPTATTAVDHQHQCGLSLQG